MRSELAVVSSLECVPNKSLTFRCEQMEGKGLMAKNTPPSNDSGDLQILWVRLNGSNTTIQDALRTLNNVIQRGPTTPNRPQLGGNNQKGLPGSNGKDKSESPSEQHEMFVEPATSAEDGNAVDHQEANESKGPVTPRTTREIRLPKAAIVDFNSASPTFRQLSNESKPSSQLEWYLLVAFWMKQNKQIEVVGLPHIVAAKQYIGQEWPKLAEDAGQVFRDACRPTSGVFESAKRGLYKITPNGEDRVRRLVEKE